MIEPLEIGVDLDCPADHAFRVWTERFGQWWPGGHSVSGDPALVVLEPRVGGRIFERTHTGQEIDWGEVIAWDPPRSLSYLWHMRRDRADATEVTVTFVEAGEETSRLEIVHRGWERLGDDGQHWRDANANGWAGLLPHFLKALSESEQRT